MHLLTLSPVPCPTPPLPLPSTRRHRPRYRRPPRLPLRQRHHLFLLSTVAPSPSGQPASHGPTLARHPTALGRLHHQPVHRRPSSSSSGRQQTRARPTKSARTMTTKKRAPGYILAACLQTIHARCCPQAAARRPLPTAHGQLARPQSASGVFVCCQATVAEVTLRSLAGILHQHLISFQSARSDECHPFPNADMMYPAPPITAACVL